MGPGLKGMFHFADSWWEAWVHKTASASRGHHYRESLPQFVFVFQYLIKILHKKSNILVFK